MNIHPSLNIFICIEYSLERNSRARIDSLGLKKEPVMTSTCAPLSRSSENLGGHDPVGQSEAEGKHIPDLGKYFLPRRIPARITEYFEAASLLISVIIDCSYGELSPNRGCV